MNEENEIGSAHPARCKEWGERTNVIDIRTHRTAAPEVRRRGESMDDGGEDEPPELDDEDDWDEDDDEDELDYFVDRAAREMGCTSMVMWGNLVAVLVDTLSLSGMPRDLIHDILDRLDEANKRTLAVPGLSIATGFVQAVRESVPGND